MACGANGVWFAGREGPVGWRAPPSPLPASAGCGANGSGMAGSGRVPRAGPAELGGRPRRAAALRTASPPLSRAGSGWSARRQGNGGASEHLADGHGGHGGEEGDAQGGERVLPLGNGQAGDHAGTEAGHRQLGDELATGTGFGAGEHGVQALVIATVEMTARMLQRRPAGRYGLWGFAIGLYMAGGGRWLPARALAAAPRAGPGVSVLRRPGPAAPVGWSCAGSCAWDRRSRLRGIGLWPWLIRAAAAVTAGILPRQAGPHGTTA